MVLHLRILPPRPRLSLESWGRSPVFRDSSLDYYTDICEMLRLDCSWITHQPEVGRKAVNLTQNARTLSEAPRQTRFGRRYSARAGAVSIRALEGSRWRGDSDAATYGF